MGGFPDWNSCYGEKKYLNTFTLSSNSPFSHRLVVQSKKCHDNFDAMTFRKMTLSIMTLSITARKWDTQHVDLHQNDTILSVVMLCYIFIDVFIQLGFS